MNRECAARFDEVDPVPAERCSPGGIPPALPLSEGSGQPNGKTQPGISRIHENAFDYYSLWVVITFTM